jgi:hypothetical protein
MQKGRWIKWFGEDAEGSELELLPATEDQHPNVETGGTIADGEKLAEGATPDMVMGAIHVNFRRDSTPKERKILSSYDEYRDLLEKSLGLPSNTHDHIGKPSEARQSHRGNPFSPTTTPPGKTLLRFSSIVAEFRLQPFPTNLSTYSSPTPPLTRFSILDTHAQWCSTILLPQDWRRADEVFSFIVLCDTVSWTRTEYPDFLRMNRPPIRDELTGRMGELRQTGEWPVYVMLVEWEEGRAERVGVGKVTKKAVEGTGAWREVVLQ